MSKKVNKDIIPITIQFNTVGKGSKDQVSAMDQLNALSQAVSIINHYRAQQKKPAKSLEVVAKDFIIEGINQCIKFNEEQVRKQVEQQQVAETKAEEKEAPSEQGTEEQPEG